MVGGVVVVVVGGVGVVYGGVIGGVRVVEGVRSELRRRRRGR